MADSDRKVDEMRDELSRLMVEQIESLRMQTFGTQDPSSLREHEKRLKRIREVSAEFILAMRKLLE